MADQDGGDELYPIAVLIDELKVRLRTKHIIQSTLLT